MSTAFLVLTVEILYQTLYSINTVTDLVEKLYSDCRKHSCVDLPTLAENTYDLQNGHISTMALL